MNKAIFLDRDGIINKEIGYVYKPEDFVLTDDIVESLKKFKEAGFIFIVITNQSGIAKGLYKHEDVARVHDKMISLFKAKGISFHAIYYCPHHPDAEPCICRKPDSGMIEKGLARFNIDPKRSYMIGDKERDKEAGEKAGLTAWQIESDAPKLQLVEEIIKRDLTLSA